jgi:hypothetical protein
MTTPAEHPIINTNGERCILELRRGTTVLVRLVVAEPEITDIGANVSDLIAAQPADPVAPREDSCALILARIAEDLGLREVDPPAVRGYVQQLLAAHNRMHDIATKGAEEIGRLASERRRSRLR